VPHALSQLTAAASESAIAVACTVGFHEGTYPTAAKVAEAEQAIAAGSREFDVVLNRDVLLAGDLEGVFAELSALRKVAPATVVIKLILETSQLARGDIVAASVLAGYAGFDFIKTSTGFVGGGATVENVALMSKIADVLSKRDDLGEFKGKRMKVKASGGVRSLGEARAMIEAGAERIGTSGGVGIMKEFLGEEQSGVGGSGGY
jgi:deoxyribose-phosphate aldolase